MKFERKKEVKKIKIEHNKKLFWIIILLIIFLVALIWFIVQNRKVDEEGVECKIDNECIAATCCHPAECVPVEKAPDCKNIMCSMVCSGPLDCGAGKCGCVKGECKVVANE